MENGHGSLSEKTQLHMLFLAWDRSTIGDTSWGKKNETDLLEMRRLSVDDNR